jgi:hypothetical protein
VDAQRKLDVWGNTVITMNAHTRPWDMKYMGKPIVVEMRT